MAYAPQPGTIPHRAVAWLEAMHKVAPGREFPTCELCEALDCDTVGFSALMITVRMHGLVHARLYPGKGKVLYWRKGDGVPVDDIRGYRREEPIEQAPVLVDPAKVRTSVFAQPPTPPIRALEFDGKLLVTGMQIRDGVAIFEPEHVLQLKQHTDWWRAAE